MCCLFQVAIKVANEDEHLQEEDELLSEMVSPESSEQGDEPNITDLDEQSVDQKGANKLIPPPTKPVRKMMTM